MSWLKLFICFFLSVYCFNSAFAVPARSVRRAAYLLAGRMPTDAELSAATATDDGYRAYVRTLIESSDF